MIRYLRLPFQFDAALMQQEVHAADAEWRLHFNSRHYEGNWSGLSLRSPGGTPDNLFVDGLGKDTSFMDTPLLKRCPYITQVIDSLPCEKTSVRLLKLEHGAVVKEHTDAGLNFEEGEARLHIPVITHPLVEFCLDAQRLEMKAGECWYINASLPHRLSNPSPVDRIHLVIDCLVNDQLKALFNRSDLPVKSVKDLSAEQAQRDEKIIEELLASGDPVRIKLGEEMKARRGM